MGYSEDCSAGLIGQTMDFPPMREDNLLNYSQPQTGSRLLGGEVGLEDLASSLRGNSGPIIPHFH